jgi:hypothetical protein
MGGTGPTGPHGIGRFTPPHLRSEGRTKLNLLERPR